MPPLLPTRFERRRTVRRAPAADEPLARMRLRAGRELTVIDVSNTGALVEGTARLLPGTHVDVHIVTAEGRTLVRGRVVRAYVSHVAAELVRYRGAVAFERIVNTAATAYAVPEILASGQQSGVTGYAATGGESARLLEERLSA